MQTAKNVFLWPDRDWLRKGFEAWFTALIELAWGKRRIMEIYINVVEWGPGIYGAEAAARYYFRKSADALNPEEAVRLVAALPDPIGWPPRPSPARPQRRDPCELAGRPLDAALALRARCIISQPALLTYRGRRISAARWIPSRDSPAAQGGPQKFVFYGAR